MFLDGDARPLAIPSFAPDLVSDPYRTTLFRLGLGQDWVIRTKGWLNRQKTGRAYCYVTVRSREDYVAGELPGSFMSSA